MSAGSARDRQFSGRRQNDEAEPFLLQQIPGSPVMRGRRQNSEEDRFPVENIPGSPVMRGRRQNSEEERFLVEDIPGSPVIRGRRQNSEEERFLVEDIPGSPIVRGRVPRVIQSTRTSTHEEAAPLANVSARAAALNVTSDTIDGPIRIPAPASLPSPTDSHAMNPTHSRSPNNDDAPPSYESSIPPTQIGWSTDVTSKLFPFPMPSFQYQDEERSSNTFSYPHSNPYPPIGLSPFATSYQSIESSRSKSPVQHTPTSSPRSSPYRPHASQTRYIITTPPPLSHYRRENDSTHYTVKPHNPLQYKYGGVVIAFGFVVFLMLLSLAVKFFIFSQKSRP